MSWIAPIDIGHRYYVSSDFMSSGLEKLLQSKSPYFPRAVFFEFREFFDLALHGATDPYLAENPSEALCTNILFNDVFEDAFGKVEWDEIGMITKFRYLTERLQDLRQIPENLRRDYEMLHRFFSKLSETSANLFSDHNYTGRQSKYNYVL